MGGAYLRIVVIDCTNGRYKIASVNQLSNRHTNVDGVIALVQVQLGLFCEEISRTGKALTGEEIVNDKIDITGSQSVYARYAATTEKMDVKSNQLQVNIFSSLSFGEIPNLMQNHHGGQGNGD